MLSIRPFLPACALLLARAGEYDNAGGDAPPAFRAAAGLTLNIYFIIFH